MERYVYLVIQENYYDNDPEVQVLVYENAKDALEVFNKSFENELKYYREKIQVNECEVVKTENSYRIWDPYYSLTEYSFNMRVRRQKVYDRVL